MMDGYTGKGGGTVFEHGEGEGLVPWSVGVIRGDEGWILGSGHVHFWPETEGGGDVLVSFL